MVAPSPRTSRRARLASARRAPAAHLVFARGPPSCLSASAASMPFLVGLGDVAENHVVALSNRARVRSPGPRVAGCPARRGRSPARRLSRHPVLEHEVELLAGRAPVTFAVIMGGAVGRSERLPISRTSSGSSLTIRRNASSDVPRRASSLSKPVRVLGPPFLQRARIAAEHRDVGILAPFAARARRQGDREHDGQRRAGRASAKELPWQVDGRRNPRLGVDAARFERLFVRGAHVLWARWLFLRALGGIFFSAFLSLA